MKLNQIKISTYFKTVMLIALFSIAVNVNAYDKFYMQDFSISAGETKPVAIQFESDKVSAADPAQLEYVAFQFDLYLPEGLTVAQKKGKFSFAFNEDRKDDHTFTSANQADGSIRVLSASLTNASFWETQGDFVKFNVQAAEGFKGGKIILKHIMFSTKDGERTELPNVEVAVNGGGGTVTPDVSVTGITLNMTTANLTVGETISLTATVTPDNATDKTVTWTTSDATVATVNAGVVTAIKAGVATITAKAGDKTAACLVTVKEKEVVTYHDKFYMQDFSISAGESKQVAIQFESDRTSAADPTQLEYVGFQFDIYMPNGLTITQSKGKYGFTFNEDRKDDHTFTSAAQADGSIRVLSASLTNASFWETMGDFVKFTVQAAEGFTGGKIILKNIMFSTKEGERTELPEVEVAVKVEGGIVTPDVNVTGITLNMTTANLTVGETITLTATVTPDNATDKTVTWTTSDATVATVNAGVVTAIKAGVATITAKAGDKTAACLVTVKEKEVVTYNDKFYMQDFSISAGESKQVAIQFESDRTSAANPTQLEYVAFQFDIYMPNGLTITQSKGKYAFTFNEDRKDDHTFTSANQADGSIRVLSASLTNASFWETTGDFVKFTVQAAEGFTGGKIILKNIMFSTKDGERTQLPDVEVAAKVEGGTVTPDVSVTGITLNVTTANLTVGETISLTATVTPDNATDKTVTWTTSDATVASVNAGVVTALKAGVATITAKAGDKTATCVVTIEEKEAEEDIPTEDIDPTTMENIMYVKSTEGFIGETIDLTVKLKHTMGVSAFQANLYMPEGFKIEKVTRGKDLKVQNDDEEYIYNFNNNKQEDGSLFLLGYSNTDTPMAIGELDIINITITIPEDIAEGDYPVILKDIELAHAGLPELIKYAKSTITVKDYIPGDANNDGRVSVTDISSIASHLLGKTPASFKEKAADANSDGRISVTDISSIASKLLKGTSSAKNVFIEVDE